jgi:hypothetical protein
LGLSVTALLIALGSYRLSSKAEQRAERAEGRAIRADERDADRGQREEDEARLRRRGNPIVTPQGVSGGPSAERVRHEYKIENAGSATISALKLWIADSTGKSVSTLAGGLGLVIPPGGSPQFAGVEVAAAQIEGELTLMVEWTDPDGTHTDAPLHPPKHA